MAPGHAAIMIAGSRLAWLLPLVLTGCAAAPKTVVEAFPPARVATPWVLQEQVWAGSFEEAAPALGEDAGIWGRHAPTRVWLALYAHEDNPKRVLTVRCFAFPTPRQAKDAYTDIALRGGRSFSAGDEGCWTPIGVLFRWGCLVFDIFGQEASWGSEVQAAMLAGCITRRMPAGVPEAPR